MPLVGMEIMTRDTGVRHLSFTVTLLALGDGGKVLDTGMVPSRIPAGLVPRRLPDRNPSVAVETTSLENVSSVVEVGSAQRSPPSSGPLC